MSAPGHAAAVDRPAAAGQNSAAGGRASAAFVALSGASTLYPQHVDHIPIAQQVQHVDRAPLGNQQIQNIMGAVLPLQVDPGRRRWLW